MQPHTLGKSKSLLVLALFAALFSLWVQPGHGQPVSSSSASVEWIAAHSDTVVRAVVEDVSAHKYANGLHLDTGINRFHTVSVRVLETLKGEAADRLQFVHNGDIRHFRFEDAKKSQQEVLLFLDRWSRERDINRAYGGYAYTRFPLVVTQLAVLEPDGSRWAHTDVPILSSKLTRLSNAKQLTDTVREFLSSRSSDRPLHGKTIDLPAEFRGGFYRLHFTSPADRVPAVPVLEFEAFKAKFAAPEPKHGELPFYNRSAGKYLGLDSLELMAIDCDVIVRAVIDDSCYLDTDSSPALGVKLRVKSVLKGECAREIGVYVGHSPDLGQLKRDRQELIVFLQKQRHSLPAAALGYQTRGVLWDDAVIVLDKDDAEVVFADLSWHRQPAEILDRLQAVLARRLGEPEISDPAPGLLRHRDDRPPVFAFHPPASLVAETALEAKVYSRIRLPVDEELQAEARNWAVSDNQDLRWLAARAMIYFKSDENAALLTTLLQDDATWGRRAMLRMMENLPHPHQPRHLVRWEAWHVLTGWGYDVPVPGFGEAL